MVRRLSSCLFSSVSSVSSVAEAFWATRSGSSRYDEYPGRTTNFRAPSHYTAPLNVSSVESRILPLCGRELEFRRTPEIHDDTRTSAQ